jgi:hypothetical protein
MSSRERRRLDFTPSGREGKDNLGGRGAICKQKCWSGPFSRFARRNPAANNGAGPSVAPEVTRGATRPAAECEQEGPVLGGQPQVAVTLELGHEFLADGQLQAAGASTTPFLLPRTPKLSSGRRPE